jgi:CheY-like chemotaxis protein
VKEKAMKQVTLVDDEPVTADRYVVDEHLEDGGLVIYPDTSLDAILERAGARRATPEEFREAFGDLPSDGEG